MEIGTNFMKDSKIKGISYITDQKNRRRAVVIDIKTIEENPEEVEDLLDIIVAESRKDEPKKNWDDVKKKLTEKK
jgi:hypothetical protein